VCLAQRQPGFTHWGSFAELVVIHAADTNLVALPAALSMVTAASLGCRFATAYRALAVVADVQPGERVVVLGCGGVGLSAVQVAVARGAHVMAVDPNPGAVALARAFGATATVPRGDAHVTVDAVGDPDVVAAAVGWLRPRGRHVQVGLLPGTPPTVDLARVLARELQLLGSHGMAAQDYPAMLALVASGSLRPDLLVGRTVGLAQAGQALAEIGRTAGITVVEIG
jgi:alcohol dehydrogenase